MSDYIHQVGELKCKSGTQEDLKVMKRLRVGESPQKISQELGA